MENLRFRAWDKGTDLMNEVTVIDFESKEVYYHHWRYGHSKAINLKGIELLQSTGLFDLDGNEIYIGDILKIEDEYTQVVFHEDNTTYGIYLEDKEGGGNPISDYSTRISLNHINGTIKGNIYEHPHLIEGDNE